jgi:hypothetical protein
MTGVPLGQQDAQGYRTQLVQPPVAEQVIRRTPDLNVQSHRGWRIFFEHVDYGAQGGEIGYAVDCATAIKTNERDVAAVSECFAIEERYRFLQTLSVVRYEWQ